MMRRALNTLISNRTVTIQRETQKRCISNRLHIKHFPVTYDRADIYHVFSSYGKINRLTAYAEAPDLSRDAKDETEAKALDRQRKKRKQEHFIKHNRRPGQTVIVHFESIQSAIALKEELHWRPFPDGKFKVTEEILKTSPKDRPLLNILYETELLRSGLRPWVVRDLIESIHRTKMWDSIAGRKKA